MLYHLPCGGSPRDAPSSAWEDPYSAWEYEDLAAFYRRNPALGATPLRPLPCFGQALGVAELHVKDESSRFGLQAFKSLGVSYALDRLQRAHRIGEGTTLVCASAGNHGRAVAHAARGRGLPCHVYMGAFSTDATRRAIAAEGAEVVVVEGTYEDALRAMVAAADARGWTIVSDTSWAGYDEIPRLIMLGYSRLVTELRTELGRPPDVVFAQGGVGGLVCGVAAGLAHEWPDARPRLVACEPSTAACLLASARAGHPVTLGGEVDTIMSGLRCAAPSPAAWPVIARLVDAYVAIDDSLAIAGMRALARPLGHDPRIEAGPSGACAFASLVAVMRDGAFRAVRDALRLGASSRVVVINTEGATDPELYDRLVSPV